MDKEELEHIYNELKSLYIDVRAEVVVAEIIEYTDTDISNFTISPKSTFSRTYRRDIINYQLGLSKFDEYDLTLNLSRSGIYDTLPEGMFHNAADPKLKSLSYQKKREIQKKEEREARLFFQPIENELFGQQVTIEQKERELHNRFASIKNNFLLEFWKIEDHLPRKLVIKLIKLLPYVHTIIGDLSNTAQCLEKILSEKVVLERDWSDRAVFSQDRKGERLGVDLVLATETATILSPLIKVIIGPISPDRAAEFVEGQPIMQFLEVFYSYFVPMEMEISTLIEVAQDELSFTLNEEAPAYMGLTTVI